MIFHKDHNSILIFMFWNDVDTGQMNPIFTVFLQTPEVLETQELWNTSRLASFLNLEASHQWKWRICRGMIHNHLDRPAKTTTPALTSFSWACRQAPPVPMNHGLVWTSMFNTFHPFLDILSLPFISQHLPISEQMLSPSLGLDELWISHALPQTLSALGGKVYHLTGIEFTAAQIC